MISSAILLSALSAIALGQSTTRQSAAPSSTAITAESTAAMNAECITLAPCKEVMEDFRVATCGPFQGTNPQQFEACLCYYNVNLEFCYNQCPSNQQALMERANVQTLVTSTCATAKLNPKALPPASWDMTRVASVRPPAPSGSAVATATVTGKTTNTPAVKSGAESTILSLGAIAAMVFAL
jgi:hypothetical protein